MDSAKIALYGLGTVSIFGILSIALQKMASGGFKLPFSKKPVPLKDDKQIKGIENQQKIVFDQLQTAQTASKEAKEKVSEIIKVTATEVQKVLNEDNLQKIGEKLDEGWEDL